MMKRTVVLIVAGLAMSGFILLQLACGGGDRAQEPPPVAQVAPPAAPAPEAPASAPAPAPVAPAPAPRPAARPPSQSVAPAPAPTAVAPAPAPAAPPPPPPPPPPRQFTLRQGTPLSVFTTSTISTSANKAGEAFSAVLAQSIVDGDWVIAKQGARVEGVVVESDPGGKVKGVASMTLALRRLTLADGRKRRQRRARTPRKSVSEPASAPRLVRLPVAARAPRSARPSAVVVVRPHRLPRAATQQKWRARPS